MQGNLSETNIGQPTVLISDSRQHDVSLWAKATADEIFNTVDLTGEKLVTATMVKAQIEVILRYYFEDAIEDEKRHLFIWQRHCNSDFNPIRFSSEAMMQIQTIKTEEWTDVLKSVDWSEAALHVIGVNLASAMHVERLNYCDDHPENEHAQAYKHKYQGII